MFSYGQIDNPLVQICQPELIGYHLLAESEMTSQVVEKQDPLDKVGNVVLVDGKMQIIEYSDLPDDVANLRNPDGSLQVWAGSIAVHVFDLQFLQRMATQSDTLPFHVASKKVAHIDSSGNMCCPEEANAIKFERFIFDLLPEAENALVVEVNRAEAFAPLKNASGTSRDSPETTRAAMFARHRAWLCACGAVVVSEDRPGRGRGLTAGAPPSCAAEQALRPPNPDWHTLLRDEGRRHSPMSAASFSR